MNIYTHEYIRIRIKNTEILGVVIFKILFFGNQQGEKNLPLVMELTNFILLSTCIKYGCINNPLFVFAQNRISVLVRKLKKNCYYNHIPSNWTINRKHFLSVLTEPSTRRPFRLHFNIPCKDFNICASIFYEETLYMYVRASILR